MDLGKYSFIAESVRRLAVAAGSVFVCLLLLGTLCGGAAAAEDEVVLEAAESFLELVDAGSLQQAWWEGSEYLHLTTSLDQWVEAERIARELFGRLESRQVKTLSLRGNQPGLPDGEYAILLYDSRFAHKANALEILVLVKDPYGDWRVVSSRLR